MNLLSSYNLNGWKAVVVGSVLGLLGLACLTFGLGKLQELDPCDRLPLALLIGVASGMSLLLSTMLLTCGLRKGPAPRWVHLVSVWMLVVFFAGVGIFLTASGVIDLFSGPDPNRSSQIEEIRYLFYGLLFLGLWTLYAVIIGPWLGTFRKGARDRKKSANEAEGSCGCSSLKEPSQEPAARPGNSAPIFKFTYLGQLSPQVWPSQRARRRAADRVAREFLERYRDRISGPLQVELDNRDGAIEIKCDTRGAELDDLQKVVAMLILKEEASPKQWWHLWN